MKNAGWVQLVGLLIGGVCCVMLAGPVNRSVFGQSSVTKEEQKASKTSKASKVFFPLSDNEREKVRARAAEFYGTTDLPNFSAKGMKVGHIGRGVIAFEAPDQSELDLDVDPCNATTEHFVTPYRKSKLSKTTLCNGKVLTYYEVEKQQQK